MLSNEMPIRRFDSIPRGAMGAMIVLVALGAISLVAALAVDSARAWQAYLINWLFFTSIAQGAVMFAVAVSMTKGMWSRGIRRIALSFVAFLPISYVMVLPLYFRAGVILPWLHEPLHHPKAQYLNMPFLVSRQLVMLALMFVLSFVFAYWSLRPDIGLARETATGKLRGLYDRMTTNWRGQEVEEAIAHKRLGVIGPILCLTYAVTMSIIVYDWVMSLEPEWFSTLIGPYFFMAAFLGGIALTGITTVVYTKALGVRDAVVQPSQFHDLGKLTFAFCVFWAYLFFSQFIVIWYGLLPADQSFVIHRFTAPFRNVALAVFAGLWLLPFFGLLAVKPKKTPHILATFGCIILTGLWLERYMLVYPSLHMGVDNLPLGWQEIGIALLFAGLLITAMMAFATRFPLFQVWQPMSELELSGLEVEVPGGPDVDAGGHVALTPDG
jgi:hypothetical protein